MWFISHKDVWTFHNKTCKKAELASFMHFFNKSETVSSLLQVKLTEHLTALLDRADGFGITPFSSSPHPSPATSLSADHCSTYFATYLKKHLWNKQIAEVSLSPLGYRSMAWPRMLILSSQEKPEPMNSLEQPGRRSIKIIQGTKSLSFWGKRNATHIQELFD